MKGYHQILNARKTGSGLQNVFVYVDAAPLIKNGNGWVKDFPLGTILIDPLDANQIDFQALHDLNVWVLGGDAERVSFVTELIVAANPKRVVANNGYTIEIITCQ